MRPGDRTTTGTRSALIVASDVYSDPGLRRLRAPASDAQALGAVLSDPRIGGFDVRTMLNESAYEVNLAVEEFFADRAIDDLLLVHFSCHGVKDEDGALYFATANTKLRRLGATAVAADFVNRLMGRTRSRRVVLLLDCCYAGAFERGMAARAGSGVAIKDQFGGRGSAVITASTAMEYAFEGDELADAQELAPSVFTSALVEGLETGEADRDQDGMIALDELYDYVYEKVRTVTPNQTPSKWTFGVQGELYIARRSRPVTTPAPLHPELQDAIDSPFPGVRAAAIPELERLLRGRHAGLALAAEQSLDRLCHDDSRTVAAAATSARAGTQPTESDSSEHVGVEPSQVVEAEAPSVSLAPPKAKAMATTSAGEVARPVVDRLRLATGGLAMVAALLMIAGLSPEFLDGAALVSVPEGAWYVWIMAVLTLGAATCLLAPRTRRVIGPGLLLPAAAASPVALSIFYIFSLDAGTKGPGYWLEIGAHLILAVAGGLAAFEVVHAGDVRFVPHVPTGMLPRLVAALGVVGSVAFLVGMLDQNFDSRLTVPTLWAAAVALVVPAVAAVAVPHRFGVALLAGWIGVGVALLFGDLTFGAVLLGGTMVALVVVSIPFARAAPESEIERTTQG
jgi:hypothetical protein